MNGLNVIVNDPGVDESFSRMRVGMDGFQSNHRVDAERNTQRHIPSLPRHAPMEFGAATPIDVLVI